MRGYGPTTRPLPGSAHEVPIYGPRIRRLLWSVHARRSACFDHCIAARAEELKSEETAALAPLVPPKARTLSGTSGTKSSLDRCYEGWSMGC